MYPIPAPHSALKKSNHLIILALFSFSKIFFYASFFLKMVSSHFIIISWLCFSWNIFQEIRRVFSVYGSVESVRFRSIAFDTPSLPRKVAFIQHKFHENRDSMNGNNCKSIKFIDWFILIVWVFYISNIVRTVFFSFSWLSVSLRMSSRIFKTYSLFHFFSIFSLFASHFDFLQPTWCL